MQVTKGTWRMCEQCVPGSLSSSHAQEPGNEAIMSHDSSSIEIDVYSNRKSLRLLKLVFFTYKGAGISQTSISISQWVLATLARGSMNISILLESLTYIVTSN